ncbi:hypothetical protein B7R21_17865 [Subtercola boreus]|uniref:Uncharacterized protein n=1 Tax=Subtercola boreus TaxID=120213 RepID=A0A3E0VAQ8_9MICO|nr:hypothetical protein B7R21_17865 [Subtercola boreus]
MTHDFTPPVRLIAESEPLVAAERPVNPDSHAVDEYVQRPEGIMGRPMLHTQHSRRHHQPPTTALHPVDIRQPVY